MKRLILTFLCSAALALAGCGTPGTTTNPYGLWQPTDTLPVTGPVQQPVGKDPVVVNAEKTLVIARDTFNLYVHLERDHEATLASASPKFHRAAERLRSDAIGWLQKANQLKNTYKHNRTETNKANLQTILATIATALSETQTLITESGLKGP